MRTRLYLSVFLLLFFSGCAAVNMAEKPSMVAQLNSPPLKILIPNETDVNAANYENLHFYRHLWNRSYANGNMLQEDLIREWRLPNDSIEVERRTDNGVAGSGIIYIVDYSVSTTTDNTIIDLKPVNYRTYKQGLIMPFPVPSFTEGDLIHYLLEDTIRYTMEVNSKYDPQSIYGNFMRLAKSASYGEGEKDDVTGDIIKSRFYLPYKDHRIYFSLKTFPYRNGTKAIIHLYIPGILTSPNTVDFAKIIKGVKSQIESIVNS